MKKCPYCAEEIHDDAVKCKHCKSDLLSGEKASTRPEPKVWHVLIVMVTAMAIYGFFYKLHHSNDEPKPETRKTEAAEPPVVEPIEYKDITPEVTNKFKSRGRQLYVRLTKIKVGDHSGIPSQEELRSLQVYRKWGRDAAKFEEECRSESSKIPMGDRLTSELSRICTASSYLQYGVGNKIVFDREPNETQLAEVKTVFGIVD